MIFGNSPETVYQRRHDDEKRRNRASSKGGIHTEEAEAAEDEHPCSGDHINPRRGRSLAGCIVGHLARVQEVVQASEREEPTEQYPTTQQEDCTEAGIDGYQSGSPSLVASVA